MDGAYRGRDYLSVKRTPYRGVTNHPAIKKQPDVTVSERKSVTRQSIKTLQVKSAVRDTYKVSSSKTTAQVLSARNSVSSVSAQRHNEKAKGFIYVEHSGFSGTFKDAFCTKRVKSDEKSCFDKIVMILLFAVLMFFVAGSYCEYYEAFKTTNAIRSEISECREEKSKLIVAIEERNNNIDIENYAENVLGMVKSDKLTTYYINISEKDVVNIDVKEENGNAANGVLLSGFKNVMSKFSDKN